MRLNPYKNKDKLPPNCKLEVLGNITDFRSGYTFRKRIEPQEGGDGYAIQMRDLNENYTAIQNEPYLIKLDKGKRRHQLKSGELLFLAKGKNNYTMIFEELNYPAVATAAFFVLTPDKQVILPEYLAWYINQPPAQRYLESTLVGSSQRNIRRDALLELEVILPPLPKQQLIAQLYLKGMEEQQMLEALKAKKRQVLQTTLLNAIGL